jgi:hypothetical protein
MRYQLHTNIFTSAIPIKGHDTLIFWYTALRILEWKKTIQAIEHQYFYQVCIIEVKYENIIIVFPVRSWHKDPRLKVEATNNYFIYLHTWCLYLAPDSVCKSLFDIRSVFNSRQSTDKQVDVTGVSLISFTGSFPQILRLFQLSSFPILPSLRQNAVWCVSYQSWSRSWYTGLDYGMCRLPELELGITAGMTSRQGMFTPAKHLIPPLIYPFSNLYFLQGLWDWWLFLFMLFHPSFSRQI